MINTAKLHRELVTAGIPINGVDSNGNIYFMATATAEQRTQAAAILAAHDPIDYDAISDLANRQALKSSYQNMITRLEQIQSATNPTNAQVVAAVQDEAIFIERLLKVLKALLT